MILQIERALKYKYNRATIRATWNRYLTKWKKLRIADTTQEGEMVMTRALHDSKRMMKNLGRPGSMRHSKTHQLCGVD